MSKEGKSEWREEWNRLCVAESHANGGIYPLRLREDDSQRACNEVEQFGRQLEAGREQESKSLFSRLKGIRTKVSRLQSHTENIEEGENYIRVLQKIIESIQGELLLFKRWARERYDGLQEESSQLTDELDHFGTVLEKWEMNRDSGREQAGRVPLAFESPIDLEKKRQELQQWKQLKEEKVKQLEEEHQREAEESQKKMRAEALQLKQELEKKRQEIAQWKQTKQMEKEAEEKERREQSQRRQQQRLLEEQRRRDELRQEVRVYRMQKEEVDLCKSIAVKQITPPSRNEILQRHQRNMEQVSHRNQSIAQRRRSESARQRNMDRLMARPSSVVAERDPDRLSQPTKAWQARALTDDELVIADDRRRRENAHERVVPGGFFAENARGKCISFDVPSAPLRAVPAWMRYRGSGVVVELYSIYSLKCPIGQKRIRYPVKGRSCRHTETFDRDTFLEFYHHYSAREDVYNGPRTCPCPICCLPLSPECLVDDQLFLSILRSVPEDCSHVEVSGGRSFRPYDPHESSEALSSAIRARPRAKPLQEVSDITWIKEEPQQPLIKKFKSRVSAINKILENLQGPPSLARQYLQRIEDRRRDRLDYQRQVMRSILDKFKATKSLFMILYSLTTDESILLYDVCKDLHIAPYTYGNAESPDMIVFRCDPGLGTEEFLEDAPSIDSITSFVESRKADDS